MNECFQKLQISNQNASHGSVTSGVDSSKSNQNKLSNASRKGGNVDSEANRSVGRSSVGTRAGSNDRVLKLKINKTKSGQKVEKNSGAST
jgi:hypothetical protein